LVDFLAAAGQRYWQMLPLGPTGYGDSPYQALSAFAGNTLLIDPEQLVSDGLLTEFDLWGAPEFPEATVDFAAVIDFKKALLGAAFQRFADSRSQLTREYESFCSSEAAWLEDYALFRAVKNASGGLAWNRWEASLARREPSAVEQARRRFREEAETEKFRQFLFYRQWRRLREYCSERGLQLIGDVPIFVAFDSADFWANRELFKVDAAGIPTVVAGVPPDYFSPTGQLWGNPVYDWARMKRDGFRWWIDRARAALRTVDLVRLDHFRGFVASWEVAAGEQTAERGAWAPAPGAELLQALNQALGGLPFIAEDLGLITPDVVALRDSLGLPGMRVLQFAFSGDPRSVDLPYNYVRNAVAYTGTHDNDTTVGWFDSSAGEGSTRTPEQVARERRFCLDYLNSNGREIHWDFIRSVLASVADTAVIPLQDVLGLGSEARMNLPGSTAGHWRWRCRWEDFNRDAGDRLGRLTSLYGRWSGKA
jgi:4-alpha-glucanotransferase